MSKPSKPAAAAPAPEPEVEAPAVTEVTDNTGEATPDDGEPKGVREVADTTRLEADGTVVTHRY